MNTSKSATNKSPCAFGNSRHDRRNIGANCNRPFHLCCMGPPVLGASHTLAALYAAESVPNNGTNITTSANCYYDGTTKMNTGQTTQCNIHPIGPGNCLQQLGQLLSYC